MTTLEKVFLVVIGMCIAFIAGVQILAFLWLLGVFA